MRRRTLGVTVAVGISFVSCGLAVAAKDEPVKLEGKGERRARLDAMQGKPFDQSLWTLVTGWNNGAPLSEDNTAGKVVVIVTWATWYQTSLEALKTAQSLMGKHQQQGLVLVALHHPRGWEKAAQTMEEKQLRLLFAHDENAKVREALDVDQDPDFYVIDRAGNLRYADVQTPSVEAAVKELLAESVEQAKANAGKAPPAAAAPAGANAAGQEPGGIVRPGKPMTVAFTKPDAATYAAVSWPAKNSRVSSAGNFQGKPLPAALGSEKAITELPSRDGRIVVLDFWATWCGPCRAAMPHLDKLQEQYPQDVVVMGISDEPENAVKQFLTKNKHGYPQAIDQAAKVKNSLQIQGIPHVVVLSSDGVIRWQGNPHPQADLKSLQASVAELVRVDPGVKARREAEDEALKAAAAGK